MSFFFLTGDIFAQTDKTKAFFFHVTVCNIFIILKEEYGKSFCDFDNLQIQQGANQTIP